MFVRRQRLTPSLFLSLVALSSLAMLLLRTTGSAAFLLAGTNGRPRAVAATATAFGGGWLSGAGRRGLASAKTTTGACGMGWGGRWM